MQLYIRLTGSSSSNNVKFSTNFDGRTCGELKAHLSGPAHDCGAFETLRLIFKGRILAEDQVVLEEVGIREGATIFLVVTKSHSFNKNSNIKPAAATTSATMTTMASSPAAAARADPISTAAARGAAGAAAVPLNSNNSSSSFPFGISMPNNSNNNRMPEAAGVDPLQSLNNNPLFQNMLQNNPEFLTNLMQQQLQSNPALQRLMDQNPLLREVLNDPAELRRLLQLQSNPDVRQQQQRLADLALQRAETLPGGFNALRQMYETMQVPLEESLVMNNNQNSDGTATDNNSAASSSNNNVHAGATGQAMPNPWGSSSNNNSNINNNRGDNADPLASLMFPGTTNNNADLLASMFPGAQPSGNTSAGNNNNFFIPPSFPGASGNLSSQPNNDMMYAAMEDPRFLQFMEQIFAQNPQMVRQFVPPQLQHLSDAQLQQMMRWSLQPDTLRNARQLFSSSPGSSAATGLPWGDGSNSVNHGLDFSSLLMGGSNNSTATASTNIVSSNYNPWASTTNTASSSAQSQPSSTSTTSNATVTATRWAHQLQQMRDMGFADEEANRAALQQAHGNLNRAVDTLLAVMGGGDSTTNPEEESSAAAATTADDTNNASSNNDNEQPPQDPKQTNDDNVNP